MKLPVTKSTSVTVTTGLITYGTSTVCSSSTDAGALMTSTVHPTASNVRHLFRLICGVFGSYKPNQKNPNKRKSGSRSAGTIPAKFRKRMDYGMCVTVHHSR